MLWRHVAVGIALGTLTWPAAARVVFDSNGFEDYAVGSIDGQYGWLSRAYNNINVEDGLPGEFPAIVELPDGNRVLKLEVPDANGALSDAYLDLNDPGGEIIIIAFDIYRVSDAWPSNLRWIPYDDTVGFLPGGLQWDSGSGVSKTLPFGSGKPGKPTIFDRFATLELRYYADGSGSAVYDGSFVPRRSGVPVLDGLNGFNVFLAHDEPTGTGPDVAYIDNLQIEVVPEPATAALVTLTGLLLVRRRGA